MGPPICHHAHLPKVVLSLSLSPPHLKTSPASVCGKLAVQCERCIAGLSTSCASLLMQRVFRVFLNLITRETLLSLTVSFGVMCGTSQKPSISPPGVHIYTV